MADTPALTELTEEERLEALRRFQVIRPFLEEGIPLTGLSRHQGVPLRTARRWVQKYRQGGLPGLIRKPRSDLGGRKMPLEMQRLIEGLALRRPPPSVAFARACPLKSYSDSNHCPTWSSWSS
jgi:transposase-like protein